MVRSNSWDAHVDSKEIPSNCDRAIGRQVVSVQQRIDCLVGQREQLLSGGGKVLGGSICQWYRNNPACRVQCMTIERTRSRLGCSVM